MRLLMVLFGASLMAPLAHAGDSTAIADQPAAASGLLDRLYPTSHGAPAHRRVLIPARPHDQALPVVRSAHADAHEPASAVVPRARAVPRVTRDSDLRLAVLDRAAACDSILCPGYSMLGVGF